MIKTLDDMVNHLHKLNNFDIDNSFYDEYWDCICHSYLNVESYEEILNVVLSLNEIPQRIVDIGSNLNQYAYIFENAGIDYVGIDCCTINSGWIPYTSHHTTFINAKYEDVRDEYKDDVIISNLCVGYQVDIESVQAKHLIINRLVDKTFKGVLIW